MNKTLVNEWQNRVAVVTGASSGIGAACCRQLAEQGMIVVGLARRVERVEALRAELKPKSRSRLHAMRCDVRQEEEVVRTFAEIIKKIGPVAVLVNNAGILRNTELLRENNSEDLRAVVETNVLGVAWCTREAFKSMKANGIDGHVILINSVAGHHVYMREEFSVNIYAPSKHAITAMTEVYCGEFMNQKTKCKITSISPGLVETEIVTNVLSKFVKHMPYLSADNVADAVVYCVQTPPHVQIHELMIKPVGERL